MRVSATLDLLKFDSKGYTKELHASIARQMRVAALAFVRAALSRIPVDTGMAAGSFLLLGRYLRRIKIGDAHVESFVSSQRQTPRGKKWYYLGKGKNQRRVPKDEHTPGNEGLVDRPASLAFQKKENNHLFVFETRVFHFTLLDLGLTGDPPWDAFKTGQEAFVASMRGLALVIPPVHGYITKSTVTIGKSGIKREKGAPIIRIRKQETVKDG
jgi:hypothetical protein